MSVYIFFFKQNLALYIKHACVDALGKITNDFLKF